MMDGKADWVGMGVGVGVVIAFVYILVSMVLNGLIKYVNN